MKFRLEDIKGLEVFVRVTNWVVGKVGRWGVGEGWSVVVVLYDFIKVF